MAILPLLASPHAGFPHLAKDGWARIGQDFSPAPQGGARMGHPAPPYPHLALLRVIIVNFSYHKILLFKQAYQY